MDRLQQIRLNKTQRRIMPGVSKLAALLKRLLREVNYTAWNWLCYCLDIIKSKAAAESCFYRRILQIPLFPLQQKPPIYIIRRKTWKRWMTNEMLDRFPQQPISKEKIWTLSKQRRFPLNAAAVKRRIVTVVTTHQNAGLCPKSRSFCCCESLKKRQSCALNGRLKKLIIKLQWWRKQSDSTEARRTRQNTAWSCGEEDECEIWGNILSVALSKLWRASARH